MSEMLEIAALGKLTIRRDGQPVRGFASRKVEALLVYLACTGREHPREAVAELPWEEQDQERASANLRMALTSLRKPLEPYILATRHTVGLNLELPYWLDVRELDAQLAAAESHWLRTGSLSPLQATQLDKALALYRGEFLAEFYLPDNRSFEAWATAERERLRRRVADALHRLVAWHIDTGAYHAGLPEATHLLQIDPLSEEAHCQTMALLAYTGQRHAALAQYETCRQQLADELGIEPTTATTALYEQIREGKLDPGTSSAVPVPTTAVPIENPYKGLRAFQEADAPDFFGRERLVRQLLDKLGQGDALPSFLAVVGPSGSGKSSVVRAGLIPALRRGDLPGAEHWTYLDMFPGAHPLDELEKALRQTATNPTLDVRSQLRHDARGLVRVIYQVLPTEDSHLFLVIDQFEEVFTLVEDEAARAHFLDSLCLAVSEPGQRFHLVITLRADFYDRRLLPYASSTPNRAATLTTS